MEDAQWVLALSLAAEHLPQTAKFEQTFGPGQNTPRNLSWCSWTTFGRLQGDAGYWTDAIPLKSELMVSSISDGGTWGQPFRYSELAHVIIPRIVRQEGLVGSEFIVWKIEQDIAGLAELFSHNAIPHRLSEYALEIKLY